MAKNTEGSKKTNRKPVPKVNKLNYKKKAKNKDNISNQKYATYLYKVILVAILAVVFYPPYLRGLFFENDFIKAELLVFIIFAVFWVYKILKKEKLVFDTPIDYASFGFVIVYLISIIAAVGLDLAVGEWLKYCMYFSVFFILTDLAAAFKNRIRVLWTISISAIGVCIIGIDAIAGNNIVNFLNSAFNKIYTILGMDIPEKGTFFGLLFVGRISSTLQYPNTLAAFLITVILVTTGLVLLSKSKIHRTIALFIGFLCFTTLIFTLSRGALLILPFVLILLLVVLPKGMRIKGVIYLAVPLLSSIPSIIKISGLIDTTTEGNTVIWLWVLIGGVICSILSLISDYVISFFGKISWKVNIFIIGGILVASCTVLVFAINAKEPVIISFPEDSQAVNALIMRSIVLKPDKEYRMTVDIEGNSIQGIESEYVVNVLSNNEKEILRESPNLVKSVSGKVKRVTVQKEIDFRVPEDSKIMNIHLYNNTRGSDIIIKNCVITDLATGMIAADIPLKYKYIPELILSRLQDLQVNKSSIERTVFYKNGLEMFGDHWLIGAGGGAWSLLYFSYQSYLYYSTQTHNYFLQTIIETGIIGLIVLLFLIFSIVFMFIKQRYNKNTSKDNTMVLQAVLFTILVGLLSHAFIDFDFSFPAMLLLMWEMLALFNAGAKETAVQVGGYKLPLLKVIKISPSIVLAISLILIIRSATVIGAIGCSDSGAKAINGNKTDLAMYYYEKAAELNPLKSEYKINYSNIAIKKEKITKDESDKAIRWMAETEKLSKYDVLLRPYISRYYFSLGDITKSLKIIENTIKLRPLRAEEWQQLASACNSAWLYYIQKDNKEQAMAMVDRALSTISWATEVNRKNMNPFIFNTQTSQILEQFTYYKDKQDDNGLTGIENIAFYNIPGMDIDSNGVSDQWNTTSQNDFVLKNENNMMKVEKVATAQDSFIQSRLLMLKPNTKYRIDLTLDNGSEPDGVRYLLTGVSAQIEKFEFVNGVHSAIFTTPERVENNTLMLYIDKSCMIKDLSIVEMK